MLDDAYLIDLIGPPKPTRHKHNPQNSITNTYCRRPANPEFDEEPNINVYDPNKAVQVFGIGGSIACDRLNEYLFPRHGLSLVSDFSLRPS